jgi:TolB-like protein/Tfp pilus assembly protein PilF
MSCLIAGFEYDIFISYRQKDNKGDHWVSEFVDALKTELESTFKEEISVYFDINPHDGLLETYDVDASLREKLKCLIFIPIISRTYCDPKSFAWEHEFKAFVEMASKDKFGLKVSLPNGNVGSRVLPVQIHDLDPDDKSCIEAELGGHIRGIDFIYKEPGVDRPLKPEDKEEKNLNGTKYNNQINKVAHAIRGIVTGLRYPTGKSYPSTKNQSRGIRSWRKSILFRYLISFIILVLTGSILFSLLHKRIILERSVAVLPFYNNSPNDSNKYFIDAVMEDIIRNLQQVKNLRVLTRTSTDQYCEKSRPTIPEIARKLNVNYLVEGSGQKIGIKFLVNIQLLEAAKEKTLWGSSYEKEIRKTSDIIDVQSEIAKAIAAELKVNLSQEEKAQIEKIPTADLTAYDFYQQGIEKLSEWRNTLDLTSLFLSEKFFHEALRYDSTFSLAYSGLANVYRFKNIEKQYYLPDYLDSYRILVEKALKFDKKNPEAYYTKALYYWDLGRADLVEGQLEIALKYNPNYTDVYSFRGAWLYTWNYDNIDYIKASENLLKAASLNHGKGLPEILRKLGQGLGIYSGFNDVAEYYLKEALKLDNDSAKYWVYLSTSYGNMGNYIKAIELDRKTIGTDSVTPYALKLASDLSFSGNNKEALAWFIKYFQYVKKNKILENGNFHRIAYAYWMNGEKDKATYWFNEQIRYCKITIQQKRWYIVGSYYDLAGVNAFLGNKKEAYKYLNLFSQIKVCPNWWLNMIKNDPLFNSLRNDSEFQGIVSDLEKKFNTEHERVSKWLKENSMLNLKLLD